MKCNKCNSEVIMGAEFCGNCGCKISKIQKNQNHNIRKNTKKIFILGFFFVVICIISMSFIVTKNSSTFDDPFDNIDDLTSLDDSSSSNDYNEVNSFVKKIEDDYKNGILSEDDYILQLAYSIYDINKLDNVYKSLNLDFNNPVELFEKAFSMQNDLSDDTLIYIFKKYTLSDVIWDVEDDMIAYNTSNDKIYNYEAKPLISEEGDVSKLSDVLLSKNNNFLIYYTTEGKNAITKEMAYEISDFLEETVANYKSKFGLEFNYKAQYDFWSDSALSNCPTGTAKGKACKLLQNNDIDINHLDTALPVFMIDTDVENTGSLGYYVPPIGKLSELVVKIYDIFDDLEIQFDNIMSTYSFPFFVVSSSLNDFDNTKIVLAHELFHHYQKYICGDGKYIECERNLFAIESTANYAASTVAGVNKDGTSINGHAKIYIDDVESSLDKVGFKIHGERGLGYGAFIFEHNYAAIVPNGYNYLFNMLKVNDPLKYLYENSNGKYKDILITMAKKNLTLDYDNKLLIANVNNEIIYPKNYKDIGIINNSQTININYSSINYYYINPQDYGITSQLSFKGDSDNLTLLLFVKEDGVYKYLYTHTLTEEFIINVDDFCNYQEVAIGIINSEISGTLKYSFELNNEGNKVPTVTANSLNLIVFEDVINKYSSFVCHQIEEDDDNHRIVMQVKLSFDKDEKISDMYFKSTVQMKNYDPNNPAFAIAQKVVSGLFYGIKEEYQKQFKHYKLITEEKDDRYSVTFKITKNYYEELRNNFNLYGEDKYSIIRTMQSENFICRYE